MKTEISKVIACMVLVSFTRLEARSASGWIPVRTVTCEYPGLGLSARISGVVRLKVSVNADGEVGKVTAISGSKVLVSAAQRNLVKWRFACVPDDTASNCDSTKPGVFDFVFIFMLLKTMDSPDHPPSFVYEYPNTVTVSGVALHWMP